MFLARHDVVCVWLCWVLFLVTWGNQPTKRPSSLNVEVPNRVIIVILPAEFLAVRLEKQPQQVFSIIFWLGSLMSLCHVTGKFAGPWESKIATSLLCCHLRVPHSYDNLPICRSHDIAAAVLCNCLGCGICAPTRFCLCDDKLFASLRQAFTHRESHR